MSSTPRDQYLAVCVELQQCKKDLAAARAEIERLRAGGCARDQRTTQWCAEAEALRHDIARHVRIAADQAQEIEALRRALHEIAEEWAGAECGMPVTAQEAYAIELVKRMARMASEALGRVGK